MTFSSAANFNGGIDTWFKQVEGTATEGYRKLVWAVFKRILQATPQWSGLAVANWNLSIGEPNMTWDPTLGDDIGLHDIAHSRGDAQWIKVATARNWPTAKQIRYRDRVFISNGVKGDSGIWKDGETKGGQGFSYLEAMQAEGSPWHQSLRDVNKPYETVQESIIIVSTLYGSRGLTLPRVGGELWEDQ